MTEETLIISGPYVTCRNQTAALSMQEMVLFQYLLGPNGEGEEWRTREQCVDRLYQGTEEPENALVCLSYYKRRLSMKLKPLGLTIEMMYGYGYFLRGVAR